MPNLFWDSCIFYAYFSNNVEAYDVASIRQHLEDARRGTTTIHTSTLALAEVVPSAFVSGDHADFQRFLSDFGSAVRLINADPNVMHLAAALKDLPYQRNGSTGRKLGTGDAIMLASCVHLTSAYGVSVDAFHTYDTGKKRGLDGGKGIPLLGYENWCEQFTPAQMAVANQVIRLRRSHPTHAAPALMLAGRHRPNARDEQDGLNNSAPSEGNGAAVDEKPKHRRLPPGTQRKINLERNRPR